MYIESSPFPSLWCAMLLYSYKCKPRVLEVETQQANVSNYWTLNHITVSWLYILVCTSVRVYTNIPTYQHITMYYIANMCTIAPMYQCIISMHLLMMHQYTNVQYVYTNVYSRTHIAIVYATTTNNAPMCTKVPICISIVPICVY
jgi:hypothetical protein